MLNLFLSNLVKVLKASVLIGVLVGYIGLISMVMLLANESLHHSLWLGLGYCVLSLVLIIIFFAGIFTYMDANGQRN